MGSVLYLSEDYDALTSIRGPPTWSNAEWIHVPYLGIWHVFYIFYKSMVLDHPISITDSFFQNFPLLV